MYTTLCNCDIYNIIPLIADEIHVDLGSFVHKPLDVYCYHVAPLF